MADLLEQEEGIAVTVTDLTFSYNGAKEPTLRNFAMSLPKGSRCLLIGQNGAGKSTLLRVLGGRHLAKPDDAVVVLGRHAFRDTKLNMVRSYLDMDWGMRTVSFAGYGVPLQADIAVKNMMAKMQAAHPERRDEVRSRCNLRLIRAALLQPACAVSLAHKCHPVFHSALPFCCFMSLLHSCLSCWALIQSGGCTRSLMARDGACSCF